MNMLHADATGTHPSPTPQLESLQKLLHFPEEVAYQLTVTEYDLFQQVRVRFLPDLGGNQTLSAGFCVHIKIEFYIKTYRWRLCSTCDR